ncbi:hypothetical protein BHL21_07280 [Bacillus cereus]|uniref:flippase n=1 Tax=Bacillus cereus TaxID=1396 RepID=UPI0009D4CB1F|nr:flippase [Bacillus cereus]OPA19008.1 hypothetical protein BHL21_07280 [Bacillus cereus]
MDLKKILKNASYLFFSDVVIKLISALVTILIARYLGATDYGMLSLALAFSFITAYFTDLGSTHTFMREATKKNADIARLVSSIFKVKICLAFMTSVAAYIIIEMFYTDIHFKNIMYCIVFPVIFGTVLQGTSIAYFQATEKMKITAYIRITTSLVTSSILGCAFIFKWSLNIIAPLYGLSSILAGIIGISILIKEIGITNGWDSNIVTGLFSFTINGLIYMILPQMGPIILEKVSTFQDVGYFSAAYRIPALLYQVPGVVAAAFYPKLFLYGNSKELDEHYKLNKLELKVMSFLGLLMALPFTLHSEWWINMLLGENWSAAAPVLSILIVMVIMQSINYPLADHLTTIGRQRYRAVVMLIALITGVTLYGVLGSKFGVVGGAYAAVSIEIIVFLSFLMLINKGIQLFLFGAGINIFSFSVTYFLFNKVIVFGNHIIHMVFSGLIYMLLVILIDKKLQQSIFMLIRKRGIL